MLRRYGRLICAAFLCCFSVLVSAQEYPLTLKNKFGTTVIEKQPERVATLDYAGADDLLALGVQPVAIRYWYGDYPKVVWPWAAPLLTSEPVVIRKPIDYELLATAKPDVIIALWSGIDQNDYEHLSKIAPVVAVPEGVGDYAMHWDERAILAGKAIGKEDKAKELVGNIRQRLSEVAQSHPDWQGKSAVVAYYWDDVPGAYTGDDIRMQIVEAFGFELPQEITDLAKEGKVNVPLSEEQLGLLDADLLVWVSSNGFDKLNKLKGWPFLQAHQDGREVFADELLTSAFSHGSLLSLPYVIDHLTPQIEQALDKPESQAAQ